ncbi:fused response regulator/phosphatase, partial [Streptomyces sp. SAS_267]
MQEDRRIPRWRHLRRPRLPRRRPHHLHPRRRTPQSDRPLHDAGSDPRRYGTSTVTAPATDTPGRPTPEPGYRILLIEDDQADALLVEELLQDTGLRFELTTRT